MGEMEELRKEADNLKDQITVNTDPTRTIKYVVLGVFFSPPHGDTDKTYRKRQHSGQLGR